MPRSEFEIFNEQYPADTSLGVLLASAARTASVNTADMTRPPQVRGVRIYINVTAVDATPSVVFTVKDKDPISGVYNTLLASAAVVATGMTVLTIFPGATAAANLAANLAIPKTWRVEAVNADADSITYSLGYCYLY